MERTFTVAEVARAFGVKPVTIRAAISKGEVRPRREPDGSVYFRSDDLVALADRFGGPGRAVLDSSAD